MGQGTCPPIFTFSGISISMPSINVWGLQSWNSICFSIQLIANASILSARNLRLSRTALFYEQPQPKLTSHESSTVYVVAIYRRIGIGWVSMSPSHTGPLQLPLQYLKQRMCLKHVRWNVTFCVAAIYAGVSPCSSWKWCDMTQHLLLLVHS